jgi:hypothetical protein
MEDASDASFDEECDAHASLMCMSDVERREKACQHILAAYTCEEPVYVRHTQNARRINLIVHKLRSLKWLAILSLVVLSIYERPVWCIRKGKSPDGKYLCDTPMYPGWGHEYMGLTQAFAWEAAGLLVLLVLESGHTFAGMRYCLHHKRRIEYGFKLAANWLH